jgi:hypothetical protein
MFLEKQDITTIRYKIEDETDYAVTGDVSESFQKVYGKITTQAGQVERTEPYVAQDQIDAMDLYRTEVLDLGQITLAQAQHALQLALAENKEPKISTQFTVSGTISTADGARITELISGGMVQVPIFSARETTILADRRQGFYSFLLVGVEVDLADNTASLTPAEARSGFEKYMAKITKLRDNR